jgi:serine/threonine protein phosphatase PrpC
VWYEATIKTHIVSFVTNLCPSGDSRAVLCRSGMAIPLTEDHKAAREDETVRLFENVGASSSQKLIHVCDAALAHALGMSGFTYT